MTAPTRTRSRSHTPARRQTHRTRGGSSPRLVVFGSVAVIALVIGAVLGAVLLGPSSHKARPAAAVNPAGTPAAEVALPSEDNPGPVRMAGVVPGGFTTGITGATAAANAYAEMAIKLTTTPEGDVTAAGRKVVAPGINTTTAVKTPVDGLRTTLRLKPDATLRVVPLGRRLDATNGSRATVSVWIAVLSATPTGTEVAGVVVPTPTEVNFLTITVGLNYATRDWKLESLRVAEGPAPALGQNAPVDAAQFAQTMQSYLPYGYLPPTEVTK